MKAKSIAALLGLFICAMPCAAQLVDVTIEPYVGHDGSIPELDGTCVFNFQPVEDGCYFDFDDNGDVGSADLLTFLSAYGSVCE